MRPAAIQRRRIVMITIWLENRPRLACTPSVPPADRSHNLRAVADLADVSIMTVSRVLSNYPHVSAATRERVLSAAAHIGYRPNPQMARLMSVVRSAKHRGRQATLGVVRDDLTEDELHDPAYQYVSTADIRRRAEHHGYGTEEFFLGRGGITPLRLTAILRARGIEGLIISPQSSRIIGAQLDHRQFIAVTFGYGLQSPALHRVSTNMMHGILATLEELSQRGYRRVGLAVTEWIDARSDHAYSGAFLFHQEKVPVRNRVPRFIFPENNPASGRDAFCAWAKKHRPDAVISFHTYVPEWLQKHLGWRIPEDIGLVVHDWTEAMQGFAGIHHRRPFVAAAAVDHIVAQLMRHERGVPEVPHQLLVLPAWIPGGSVRLLPHEEIARKS